MRNHQKWTKVADVDVPVTDTTTDAVIRFTDGSEIGVEFEWTVEEAREFERAVEDATESLDATEVQSDWYRAIYETHHDAEEEDIDDVFPDVEERDNPTDGPHVYSSPDAHERLLAARDDFVRDHTEDEMSDSTTPLDKLTLIDETNAVEATLSTGTYREVADGNSYIEVVASATPDWVHGGITDVVGSADGEVVVLSHVSVTRPMVDQSKGRCWHFEL